MTFFPIIFYLEPLVEGKTHYKYNNVDDMIVYIKKNKLKLKDYVIILKRNNENVGKITIKEYFRINEVVEFQKNF